MTAVVIHQVLKTQNEIQHLTTFSLVLQAAIDDGDTDFLKSIHSDAIRITLIDKDGTVLYDSDHDARLMENHISREEITAALNLPTRKPLPFF